MMARRVVEFTDRLSLVMRNLFFKPRLKVYQKMEEKN